jgi:hypothetical protein
VTLILLFFHVSFRWFTNYNKKLEISAYINEDQWSVYQQYDPALEPLKDFFEFCQSAQVIVHWELFKAQRALERLSAPFLKCMGISPVRIKEHVEWQLT